MTAIVTLIYAIQKDMEICNAMSTDVVWAI
jgi:hypothetical protein